MHAHTQNHKPAVDDESRRAITSGMRQVPSQRNMYERLKEKE